MFDFDAFDPGFVSDGSEAETDAPIPIFLLSADNISFEDAVYDSLSFRAKNWIAASDFKAQAGAVLLVPDDEGALDCVLLGTGPAALSEQDPLICGVLPGKLPPGVYVFVQTAAEREAVDPIVEPRDLSLDTLAWALGFFRFDRYTSGQKATPRARLILDESLDAVVRQEIGALARATAFGRTLITTPANDMGPGDLAGEAEALADRYGAQCRQIVGDALIDENFPLVHTVGRASAHAPRLIEIIYGDDHHPKVTLVGKGVVFDSGGLDIKPASAMLLMKKDMGGAAVVLALASALLEMGLKIRLRVIVPAVENSISGNAFRPGDVLPSRDGKTVEIGNTDAEGRLILADALALAADDHPDLIVDMATLTGAARVALGLDVPALFSNDANFAQGLQNTAMAVSDPLWQLPLWCPYRTLLDSKIADINHISPGGYGGAITAALFLDAFVDPEITWAHIDLMAYNTTAKPGRPVGGEVQGLRALYHHIKTLYHDPAN